MSKALKERWGGKRSPFDRLICRMCAPEMFPEAALAEYPLDSYHYGSRFTVFQLFGVMWDITLNGKPLVAPVREVRGSEDGSTEGWAIVNVATGMLGPGQWLVEPCSCARGSKEDRQAEMLIFGRITMKTKNNPSTFSLS